MIGIGIWTGFGGPWGGTTPNQILAPPLNLYFAMDNTGGPLDQGDLSTSTLARWFTDSVLTIPATTLPSHYDNVTIDQLAESNAGYSGDFGITTGSLTAGTVSIYGCGIQFYIAASELIVIGGYIESICNVGNFTGSGCSVYGSVAVTSLASFGPESSNYGSVTGNAIFDSSSYNNGVVTGDASFVFNSYNIGTVIGDAIFQFGSFNNAAVSGDAAFYYSNNVEFATVTGNATFGIDAHNQGEVIGNASFHSSSYNYGSVTGDATFDTGRSNMGVVAGIATVLDASNGSYGFENTNVGSAGNWLCADGVTPITSWTFFGSNNNGDIIGNAIFQFGSFNNAAITGDATFDPSSYNQGTVEGNAYFTETLNNNGSVQGNVYLDGILQ